MKAKIAIQLGKEFLLPFIGAALWTGYTLQTMQITLVNAITIFGPAFFLISWLVGQFFRVKKQVGVERSLGSVEDRLKKMTTDLEEIELRIGKISETLENNVNTLVGHLNGGDSFCYLRPSGIQFGKRQWQMMHCGNYPMRKLVMKFVDTAYITTRNEEDFQIDEIPVGNSRLINSISASNSEHQAINIFFESRSGRYQQETKFANINGIELWALRVVRDHETLLQVLPENFPLSENDERYWINKTGVSGTKKQFSIDLTSEISS